MSGAKRSRPAKKRSAIAVPASLSDELNEILGELSRARSFIEIAHRLMDEEGGDELICLEHGIELFKVAYRKLDETLTRMPTTVPNEGE